MNSNLVYQFYADHVLVHTYKSVGACIRHAKLRKRMFPDMACVVKEYERVYLLGGTENDFELVPTGREVILRYPMIAMSSDDLIEDNEPAEGNEAEENKAEGEIATDLSGADGFTDEELSAVL